MLDTNRLDARFYGPAHLSLLETLRKHSYEARSLESLVNHLAHVTGYESSKHMAFVEAPSAVRVVEAQNVGDTLLHDSGWKRIDSNDFSHLSRHHLYSELTP
jgi:hypothetical protein